MNVKPFIKVCESKVLRRAVVVCCGPKDKLKELYFNPATFKPYGLSKQIVHEDWQTIERTWDEVCAHPGGALGFTLSHDGDVFIVMPKWSLSVFIHEAYHATQAVLRIIGTQDEELGAFFIEWLFEECALTKQGKVKT